MSDRDRELNRICKPTRHEVKEYGYNYDKTNLVNYIPGIFMEFHFGGRNGMD